MNRKNSLFLKNRRLVLLVLFKVLTLSAVVSIFTGLICAGKMALAGESGISEPLWYRASIELKRPAVIKKGVPGIIKFYFTPLITGEFMVKASCRGAAGGGKSISFVNGDEGAKSFKAAAMKTASCEFEFIASEPAVGKFALEFSVNYPAQELIRMVVAKFGTQLYESKKLIQKIKSSPEIYSATLPLKMIVSDVECAVNPEIYFEKNADDEFLNIKPVISRDEASEKIRSFEAKYAGIFELSETEFVEFIRRTNCDFLKDLNDYFKGLHAYNYYGQGCGYNFNIVNRMSSVSRASDLSAKQSKMAQVFKMPICSFEKAVKFMKLFVIDLARAEKKGNMDANKGNAGGKNDETKNSEIEYVITTDGPLSGAGGNDPIYLAAFYNLFFVENFKNSDGVKEKEEALKNFEAFTKLVIDEGPSGAANFGGMALFADAKVRNALEGYFLYNAGLMHKKNGALDYGRYFQKATAKNKGLIIVE